MVRRAEANGMFQAYEMHTYIISIRFSRTMLLQPDPTRIEEQHGFSTARQSAVTSPHMRGLRSRPMPSLAGPSRNGSAPFAG
jgi:hypothetical protein